MADFNANQLSQIIKNKKVVFTNEIQRWAFESLIDQLALPEQDDDENVDLDQPSNPDFDELQGETSQTGFESRSETQLRRAARKPKVTKSFRLFSNSMSRTMPGVNHKNVSTERLFVKEMMELSHHRYLNLLNMNFQNRLFTEKQMNKGILIDTPVKSVPFLSHITPNKR
jgi:hypothetical protein